MRRVTASVVILSALLAGCGGEDGPEPFSASQVARSFQAVTGDRLVADPGASDAGTQVLRLEQSATDATINLERYGSFSIYVVEEGEPAPLYRSDLAGEEIAPSPRGVYWRRLSRDPPAWQASKAYRNVVLQWQAGDRRALDARFERLDAALSAIERPQDARLPPQDRPCREVGIDPVRGRQGTCKLGAQTLVVVNRSRRLELPGYDVDGVRVERAREVRSQELLGRARARGRYVIVRFRVRNRAREPLERVSPTLAVGARRYALDTRALFLLQQRSPFPVQPGARATVVAVWDVPARAAAAVDRVGALLVDGNPAGGAATITGASVLGRVRLGRTRDR